MQDQSYLVQSCNGYEIIRRFKIINVSVCGFSLSRGNNSRPRVCYLNKRKRVLSQGVSQSEQDSRWIGAIDAIDAIE